MRKLLSISLFLILGLNSLLANEIVLEKHYKVLETFSGDIKNKETFHVIIAKNKDTKTYDLIPISFFNNNLVRLLPISFKQKPSIRSYHSSNNIITLIICEGTTYPINKMALDINLETGAHKLSGVITTNNFKAVLREENKSFLITNQYSDLKITRIEDVNNISTIDLKKNKANASFLKRISKSRIGSVNTNKFVKNGSINSFKMYCDNDILYLTKDDFSNRLTSVITLDTKAVNKTNNSTLNEYRYDKFKAVKEVSSYLYNNCLYQLLLNNDVGFIQINNLNTGTFKSISLNKAIMDLSIKGEGFVDLKSFLKHATKTKKKSTITVNESLNGEYILRCDFVDSISYGFNYNWWFHQQQQFHLNSLPQIGPNNSFFDLYYDSISESNNHYFEIIIDQNFNVLDKEKVASKFKYINKNKYFKNIDDNENLKHVSTVFLDDVFVYFYLDSKSNSFKVSNKTL